MEIPKTLSWDWDTKKLGKHQYGCLMLYLPLDLRKEITDFAVEEILDCQLGAGGRECTPHVTVKFGFTDDGPETVEQLKHLLGKYGPIKIRLESPSLFAGGKNEDGDVLKIDVESDVLRRLNEEITSTFDCVDKYPEYRPHVTISYLDPAASEAVLESIGIPDFCERDLVLDEAVWSRANGDKEFISLSILPKLGQKSAVLSWDTKDRGQPCRPGETAAQTGCIPASNSPASPQSHGAAQSSAPPAQSSAPPAQSSAPPAQSSAPPAQSANIKKQPKKSLASVNVNPIRVYDNEFDDIAKKLFPSQSKDSVLQELASLVGAPDDAEVTVQDAGRFQTKYADDLPIPGAIGFRVQIQHPFLDPGIDSTRFIGVDKDGKKFIRNESLFLKLDAPRGTGLKIFTNQVDNATANGFSRINTHAAGHPGSGLNGFYTWPLYGYDMSMSDIDKFSPGTREQIRRKFPQAKSIRDVFDSPGGREWWKQEGSDLYDANFDLTEGSRSHIALDDYHEEQLAKIKAVLSWGHKAMDELKGKYKRTRSGGDNINLSEEEIAAAERACDKRVERIQQAKLRGEYGNGKDKALSRYLVKEDVTGIAKEEKKPKKAPAPAAPKPQAPKPAAQAPSAPKPAPLSSPSSSAPKPTQPAAAASKPLSEPSTKPPATEGAPKPLAEASTPSQSQAPAAPTQTAPQQALQQAPQTNQAQAPAAPNPQAVQGQAAQAPQAQQPQQAQPNQQPDIVMSGDKLNILGMRNKLAAELNAAGVYPSNIQLKEALDYVNAAFNQALQQGTGTPEQNLAAAMQQAQMAYASVVGRGEAQAPTKAPEQNQPQAEVKKSNAPVSMNRLYRQDFAKLSKDLFPGMNEQEALNNLSSMIGAPDDAKITVTDVGNYEPRFEDDEDIPGARGVRVRFDHPALSTKDDNTRFIGLDGDGNKFMLNEKLVLKKEFQRTGMGREIFASQVDNAIASGFKYIRTHAAGTPDKYVQPGEEKMNGYFTWPLFGYDMPIDEVKGYNPDLYNRIKQSYPNAKSVLDLMDDKDSRDWWSKEGGDLHKAIFDLNKGSRSLNTLNSYLAKKRAENPTSQAKNWLRWKYKSMNEDIKKKYKKASRGEGDFGFFSMEDIALMESILDEKEKERKSKVSGPQAPPGPNHGKTLSWMNVGSGGALVPPPQQGLKKKPRKSIKALRAKYKRIGGEG